jgi:hypothetical protein
LITTAIIIFLYNYLFGEKKDAEAEHHRYQIIDIIDGLEIRKYNNAVYASVYLSGNFKDHANRGFRVLAAFIFGANSKRDKISMTLPIRLRSDGLITEMSLRMPDKYTLENLPKPKNKKIIIKELSHGYCAVLHFGGFSPNWRIQNKVDAMKQMLKMNKINYSGSFEFLTYNPPYKLRGRRNEIIVHLPAAPKSTNPYVNRKRYIYLEQ